MTATVTTALGTARNTLFALALGAWRILIAVKHRRVLSELASLDDRRLADIGLTRSDLRDARSQPLWHDPTRMLAGRAATRRVSRRRTAFELSAAKIAGGDCHPSADRPAGYLT